MSKNHPDIDRLLTEFKAEDMATWMQARVEGKPVVVARWLDGSKSWEPTQEGRNLLYPELVAPASEEPPKMPGAPQGMPRLDVRPKKA